MHESRPAMEPAIGDLFSLRGKTALITGASGHLGAAMARGLAEAGARVIVSSRHLEKGETLAAELREFSEGNHFAVEIDHLQESSIQQGFSAALSSAGQIDVMVNNGHAPSAADWRSVTGDEFRQQLENLTGYFLLSRLFRDQIVSRKAVGSLILVGSMYGIVGSYPDVYEGICSPSPVAYQALKGGIVQMTRHLAVYWAKDQVRVNCLSPGPFPGPQVPGELIERLERKCPLERMGSPAELKGPLVFLASAASSYMTGQNLLIDGGWTAW